MNGESTSGRIRKVVNFTSSAEPEWNNHCIYLLQNMTEVKLLLILGAIQTFQGGEAVGG